MNTILVPGTIYLLLAMELGGLRVELYTDPGSKLGSFPLLFHYSLALACTADSTRFASLVISEEEEDRVMKTWGQEDHNDEDDERLKIQEFEDNP